MLTIIFIILIIAALATIAVVVTPKLTTLSSLKVEPSPEDKLKQLKKNIVVNRISRRVKALGKKIFTPETRRRVGEMIKGSFTKLKVLEEKYRSTTAEVKLEMLLKKGQDNITDDPDLAEQCFIEVINLDKRNIEAYIGLAQIYLAKKKLDEAEEVIEFLAKLNHGSADKYIFSLAEAYLQSGDVEKARKYGERALKKETENPRYIDFLTEIAILDKNKKEAKEHLAQLKEANPENAKIEDFKDRIKEIK